MAEMMTVPDNAVVLFQRGPFWYCTLYRGSNDINKMGCAYGPESAALNLLFLIRPGEMQECVRCYLHEHFPGQAKSG